MRPVHSDSTVVPDASLHGNAQRVNLPEKAGRPDLDADLKEVLLAT